MPTRLASSNSGGLPGSRRQPEIACDTRKKVRAGRCLQRVVTTTFPQKVEGGPRRHRRDIVNRAELIDAIRDRLGIEKKTAEHAVDAVLDTIQRAVAQGEKVAITGFGVFEKVDRAARTGRNPRTGEAVKVKKTSVPKFRPGSQFKGVVSGAVKLGKVADAATKAVAKSTATTARTTARTAASGPSKAAKAARSAAKKAGGPTTRRTTGAKATTKSAAKSTAKKTTSKAAATKKSTAKRTTAKKTAKR